MLKWTRRAAVLGLLALSACASQVSSSRGEIDTRVKVALDELYATVPGARAVAEQSVGMLVMPRINEAGFIYGASYGEGALQVRGATVDYYSSASASIGLQAGAQRYSTVLFFMTPEALADFRTSDGWEVGADAEYAIPNQSAAATVSSGTFNKPIYVVVFGQQGILAAAAIKGNKYSRITR